MGRTDIAPEDRQQVHSCQALQGQDTEIIRNSYGQWEMRDLLNYPRATAIISFCPYCGKDLRLILNKRRAEKAKSVESPSH